MTNKGGRPPSPDLLYARAHGVSKRRVKRNGGSKRLAQLEKNQPAIWRMVLGVKNGI